MARRRDRDRVLVAQVLGAASHGDSAAELLAVADGRRDVLEAALVIQTTPDQWGAKDPEVAERLRAAVERA